MYGIVFFLTNLLEYFLQDKAKDFSGSIEVGCDNESSIPQCFEEDKHIVCKDTDHDLIIAIRRRISQFPHLKWIAGWIEGHQDDHLPEEQLDPWARLNRDMDTQAKAYWRRIYQPEPNTPLNDPPEHRIFLAPWTVRIHGRAIVTKFKSII